jgi:hypothetical protein
MTRPGTVAILDPGGLAPGLIAKTSAVSLWELPLTPADPTGLSQRLRTLPGEPLTVAPSRGFPDLVLLDEAAHRIGMVPAVALPGARIPAFYAYWLSCLRPGALPDLSAVDPLLMPPEILPFIVVYAVEPDRALRMRLIGTAVVERTGADLTGRVIEPFGVTAVLHARLTWCLKHRRPYLAHGQVPAAERDFIQFTALAVPFGDRDGAIRRVVSVLQFTTPR